MPLQSDLDGRARRRLMRAVAEGIDRYFREPAGELQMASAGGAAAASAAGVASTGAGSSCRWQAARAPW